jgi:hypothetical protein
LELKTKVFPTLRADKHGSETTGEDEDVRTQLKLEVVEALTHPLSIHSGFLLILGRLDCVSGWEHG